MPLKTRAAIADFHRAGRRSRVGSAQCPRQGIGRGTSARLDQASHRCRQPACAERRCGADDQEADRVVDYEEEGGKRRRFRGAGPAFPVAEGEHPLPSAIAWPRWATPASAAAMERSAARQEHSGAGAEFGQDAAGHEAERGDVAHKPASPTSAGRGGGTACRAASASWIDHGIEHVALPAHRLDQARAGAPGTPASGAAAIPQGRCCDRDLGSRSPGQVEQLLAREQRPGRSSDADRSRRGIPRPTRRSRPMSARPAGAACGRICQPSKRHSSSSERARGNRCGCDGRTRGMRRPARAVEGLAEVARRCSSSRRMTRLPGSPCAVSN